MTKKSSTITEGCEQFRIQLQTLQRELPLLLNQADPPIHTDVASHYNQVMYHLQAAREELRAIQQQISSDLLEG